MKDCRNCKEETAAGKAGYVWLLGAGPGDAGLLTLKGARVISKAEAVVYDALVGEGILSRIPAEAEQIYVGKRGGCHAKSQEEINRILVEEAEKGRRVVRLKGGDPFVFGRGGEEARALKSHGIPFEIIPGVTSAVAVPAYCGIPVTHRGTAASFHVITGHFKNGEPIGMDYDALVRMGGTLIFLMGLSSAGELCAGLLAAGMRADMPAALLQEGTTAGQKKVLSVLSRIKEDGKKAGIQAPAILLVGEVCDLEDSCRWEELLPLSGKRVLVTRPRRRAGRLASLLEEAGAETVEFPVIETHLLAENEKLKAAAADFGRFDWLAFTSPSGVEHFFRFLKENRMDIRTLAGLKLAVIGRATGEALEAEGLYCDYMPERFYAADLGKGLAGQMKSPERLLLLRASRGSKELLKPLLAAGISCEDVPLYETVYPADSPASDRIREMLKELRFDYVTFTSASTVDGFLHTFSLEEQALKGFTAVCIGEETAKHAREQGMRCIMAETPSMDSMVKRMLEK